MCYNINAKAGEILKKKVLLKTAYMTLGQLLKAEDVVGTGGQAKWYLKNHDIKVNGKAEDRRGKKLYPGDQVAVPNVGAFLMQKD